MSYKLRYLAINMTSVILSNTTMMQSWHTHKRLLWLTPVATVDQAKITHTKLADVVTSQDAFI